MTSSDILAKLFSSANRVKLIRMFLLNPEEVFPIKDICRKAKVLRSGVHKEISLLKKIDFIKQKKDYISVISAKKKRGAIKFKKKRIQGWKMNDSFPLLIGLKSFVLDTAPISRDQLLKKLQKAGKMKLVILSGIFSPDNEDRNGRVDIFVVGDAIRKSTLEKVIRDIEAEVGKELTYAYFSTQDFIYRLGMYDRFIRDILDYQHEKILDKIGL